MYKKNTKRFMVIFERWSSNIFNQDVEEFDDAKDADKHADLISKIYDNAKDYDRYGDKIKTGYVVLDFQREKILRWGKSNEILKFSKRCNPLRLKDIFFRKEEEIPANYVWDDGEYEGWLQYRWGDGRNAIDYKQKSGNKSNPITNENDDDVLDCDGYYDDGMFDAEIEKEKFNLKKDKW